MVQKSCIATILALFFTINTLIAEENENSMKEDTPIANKFGKIFFEKDADQFRKPDPHILEILALMYRQREFARLKNLLAEHQESGEVRDADIPLMQLISDWMRREEMKRKRAHHRALCHFKICNMGSKRSYTWDMWPNYNQEATGVTL